MNAQRLHDIFKNIAIAEKSDMESIRQLTVDYPYYYLPYVVLAKYYYDTGHYKFEDMLRQAAMRVKDRKELYRYIHGREALVETPVQVEPARMEPAFAEEVPVISEPAWTEETYLPDGPEIHVAEESIEPPEYEPENFRETLQDTPVSQGVSDFLQGFTGDEAKPEEFVFEGRHDERHFEDIQVEKDVIGEEIATEFSFSRSFHAPADEEKTKEPEQEKIPEEPVRTPKEDLRKNPIYQVEDIMHNAPEPETEEELSPEKDFFAWLKHPQYIRQVKEEKPADVREEKDRKIELIEKFISVNPQISRPKKEFYNPENMAKKSEVIDLEYVTETLANIYYEQGNIDLAIRAYEKLSLQNPSKQAYFASLIEKIRKERK